NAPGPSSNPLLQGSSTDSASAPAGGNVGSGGGGSSGASGELNSGMGLDSLLGAQGQASNSSSTNPSTGTAGLSLGSVTGGASSPTSSASSPASGAVGLSLGSDSGASSSKANGTPDMPTFKSRIHDGPTKTIEVPF